MKPGMIELGMEEYRKNPDLMLAYWRHEREDIDGKRGKAISRPATSWNAISCILCSTLPPILRSGNT